MQLKTLQKLELPASADMHVHLRQGEMMDVVVPTLEQGGVDTAFVYVETPWRSVKSVQGWLTLKNIVCRIL